MAVDACIGGDVSFIQFIENSRIIIWAPEMINPIETFIVTITTKVKNIQGVISESSSFKLIPATINNPPTINKITYIPPP